MRTRLFSCLILYLGAGFAMGLHNGRRGTSALPHAQQWAEVFAMAREGCAIAAYKLGIASKPGHGYGSGTIAVTCPVEVECPAFSKV